MRRIFSFIFVMGMMLSVGACARKDAEPFKRSEIEPSPTAWIQACVMPLTFTDKSVFQKNVLDAHEAYKETGELSEHRLETVRYYYDFSALPQEAVFKELTVAEDCDYISLLYELKGLDFSLTWYKADFGDGYDHFESSKAATSGMPQQTIAFEGHNILEAYHDAGETGALEYYSYYWQEGEDYIDMTVPAGLVYAFGAEAFLSVGKIAIAFGDIFPAEVMSPSSAPSESTPIPVPETGPTMTAG